MFEVKIQTYWADTDAAGIVFFPHFFRFIEQAEEEMFRSAGAQRHKLMEMHQVWFPRVEAFSRYLAPIGHGDAIRVRMTPSFKGEKTIRLDFEIVSDPSQSRLAEGYITMVCVDRASFKSRPVPNAIREVYTRLQ
jgi:acyl-CoA thioester hydrolase